MAQQGFLLIADITGYTMFLTRSELEHAQGILDALFKSIFAEIKPPIILSNLQGDAALTYLPDANLPQRQFPLDAIERIYCSFANTLGAMRLNTTCTCNACRNMNQLDLKFSKRTRYKKVELIPQIDWFNVSKTNTILSEVNTLGPRLDTVLSILDPGFVRFGLTINF